MAVYVPKLSSGSHQEVCYLYCLTFKNGKHYIGLTLNIKDRIRAHRKTAQQKSMPSIYAAIRKYGFPECQIICIGEFEYITELEGKTILAYRTHLKKFGYNRMIGPSHSLESRARISAAKMGTIAWNLGLPRTPEEKIAISEGILTSPNWKSRGGWNKGIPHSPEARAKQSAAGKGRPKSPEHQAKINAVLRSPEVRAKISAAIKGKPKSPEHVAKLVAARKRCWENKRNNH